MRINPIISWLSLPLSRIERITISMDYSISEIIILGNEWLKKTMIIKNKHPYKKNRKNRFFQPKKI